MSISHPPSRPAMLAVALLTCFFELAGMWVGMTETTVARHLDKLYFGKSCCLEWDFMALIAFERCVMLFDWACSVVNHLMTGKALYFVFFAV